MRRAVQVCAALAALLLAACERAGVKYNSKMSLHQPYFDSQGYSPAWRLVGDAFVLSQGSAPGVYFTNSQKGSAGGVAAKGPLKMKEWRVEAQLSLRGCRGVGIWVTEQPAERAGALFGGPELFTGALAFLSLEKTAHTPSHPAAGVLVGEAGRVTKKALRKVSSYDACTLALEYLGGELRVSYGRSKKEMEQIGAIPGVRLGPGYYVTLLGGCAEEGGSLSVQSVSSYLLALPAKKGSEEEEAARTNSSLSWVVFLLLSGGVGLYLCAQKRPAKDQKIIKD